MENSIDALRKYIEKIAKKVLNDESSKNVIAGTIINSTIDGYEVQLINGSSTTTIIAESLYSNKTYNKNDYVYLIAAQTNRGENYGTKYFIFGLVDVVKNTYANLSEVERFLGDSVEIALTDINTEESTWVEINSEEIEETEETQNFFNILRTSGVLSISAYVSSNIVTNNKYSSDTFGIKIIATFDNNQSQEVKWTHKEMTGQVYLLNQKKQNKIINFNAQNQIKSLRFEVYNDFNGSVNIENLTLQAGSLLEIVNNFSVSIRSNNAKTYFKQNDTNHQIEIEATVSNNNQKLDTKLLKYYWFVDCPEGEENFYFNPLGGEGWRCLNEGVDVLVVQDIEILIKQEINNEDIFDSILIGKIVSISNETTYTVELQQNDSIIQVSAQSLYTDKNFAIEDEVYVAYIKALQEESYIDTYFIFNTVNSNIVNSGVKIYNTESNILTIDYDKANYKNWLSQYQNKIKCVATYQMINAESNILNIFNFNHEKYDVGLSIANDIDLPLLYADETITIKAELTSKLILPNAAVVKYRWKNALDNEVLTYLQDEDNPDSIVEYDNSKITVGWPQQNSTKDCYKLTRDYEKIYCEVFINDILIASSLDNVIDEQKTIAVWCKDINKTQEKEEIKHYKAWVSKSSSLLFEQFTEEIDVRLQTSSGLNVANTNSYINYNSINDELNNTVLLEIPNETGDQALQWLNGNLPFANMHPGFYYLYYSEAIAVIDSKLQENNLLRFNDYSYPQILRCCVVKDDLSVEDVLSNISTQQLNTFNTLTKGGKEEGIFYSDQNYKITQDSIPDIDKIRTGDGYYKKIIIHTYKLENNLTSFEQNKDYYTVNEEGGYDKVDTSIIMTPENENMYYTVDKEEYKYILRPVNENNYECDNNIPTAFINGEEYYEQDGGNLYINASYIRTGTLEVTDGLDTIFRASVNEHSVKIGPFEVNSNELHSIELGDDEDKGDISVTLNKIYATFNYAIRRIDGLFYKNNTFTINHTGITGFYQSNSNSSLNNFFGFVMQETFNPYVPYYTPCLYANKNLIIAGNSDSTINLNGPQIKFSNDGGKLIDTWSLNGSGIVTDSDLNLKNSIENLSNQYEILFDNLIPQRFKYNNGTSNRYHTGFIAQDVKQAIEMAGLNTNDFAAYVTFNQGQDNEYSGLRYEEFIALCVDQIQKLKKKVQELEQKMEN